MIKRNFSGVGTVGAARSAGTLHAAHAIAAAAALAAAGKHRIAAATDASVDRGST